MQGAARLNRNPERSAGFVVLKAPDFPSVLVELGYLSNAQDVQAMSSPDWRAKTASAMANAIDRFFAAARSDGEAAPKAADAVAASDKATAAEAASPKNPAAAGQGAERADAMKNAAAGRPLVERPRSRAGFIVSPQSRPT